jgi:tetratricopeptide (TPR) repeat protein
MLTVQPGDLIVSRDEQDWNAIKILLVDPWPDGSAAAHCLIYETLPTKPTLEVLRSAEVRLWHTPIDAGSFRSGWELIGNQAPSNDECVGFIEYLKLTDFSRYVSFTGVDGDQIVRQANQHYEHANELAAAGQREEAIAAYGEAIDLFPLFFEAIDNRALTYMELDRLPEALHDFERSLQVNPEGVTAVFSRAECLMKLGQLDAAESAFQEGLARFPEHKDMFVQLLEHIRAIREQC